MTADAAALSERWWLGVVIGVAFAAFFLFEYFTKEYPGPISNFVSGWLSGALIVGAWCARRQRPSENTEHEYA